MLLLLLLHLRLHLRLHLLHLLHLLLHLLHLLLLCSLCCCLLRSLLTSTTRANRPPRCALSVRLLWLLRATSVVQSALLLGFSVRCIIGQQTLSMHYQGICTDIS